MGGATRLLVGGVIKFVLSIDMVLVGDSTDVISGFSGGFSRLQPWISMATRPVTLTASTQNTASLRRERRWLCCSSSEPLGTNGFGLFIMLLAQMRPGSRSVFGFEFGARNFPSKNSAAH